MKNILVAVTGSVASIKLPILLDKLLLLSPSVRVVTTEHAQHFFKRGDIPDNVTVYRDADEWEVNCAWYLDAVFSKRQVELEGDGRSSTSYRGKLSLYDVLKRIHYNAFNNSYGIGPTF
jgi:hypothetical protein